MTSNEGKNAVDSWRWGLRDVAWDEPWNPANTEFGMGEVLVGYEGSVADLPLIFGHGSLRAVEQTLREVGPFFTYGLVLAGDVSRDHVEAALGAQLGVAPCEGRWSEYDKLVLTRFGWIDDDLRNPEYQPALGLWDNTPPPFEVAAPRLEVRRLDYARGGQSHLPTAALAVGVTGESTTVTVTIPLLDRATLRRELEHGRVYSGGGHLVVPDDTGWDLIHESIVAHVCSLTVERDWAETLAKLTRMGQVSKEDLERPWWRAPAC
jgi:hypothetical protein